MNLKKSPSLLRNNSGIIEGGIYLMITIVTAAILYMVLLPVIDTLMVQILAVNPEVMADTPHFEQRVDYGVSLIIKIPLLTIIVAAIFFIMRAIRKQGYSRYEDEYN